MKFAVWHGFWARQAIQDTIQALMKGRKDGKSIAIPERFQGELREVSQNQNQGLKSANFLGSVLSSPVSKQKQQADYSC